jgi:hypothetical protein
MLSNSLHQKNLIAKCQNLRQTDKKMGIIPQKNDKKTPSWVTQGWFMGFGTFLFQ